MYIYNSKGILNLARGLECWTCEQRFTGMNHSEIKICYLLQLKICVFVLVLVVGVLSDKNLLLKYRLYLR